MKVRMDRRTNKTRKYSSSFFEGGGERHTGGENIWGKLLLRKKKVLVS